MTSIVIAMLAIPALADGDARAGADKSIECIGCHGDAGISRNDIWPNIACQNPGYLKKVLDDFRAGRRREPIMASVARQLSDADIANLAAYYSRLPGCPGT